MPDEPILVCYDGSDNSRRAIEVAASLLGSRRAVVLDVGPTLTRGESLVAMTAGVSGTELEQMNVDDALSLATEGAELAHRAGFSAEARSTVATPSWEGIVEVADEIDAPLIVIGSSGLRGIRELVEGSTSHDVAEHAGRPMLIVPPAGDG